MNETRRNYVRPSVAHAGLDGVGDADGIPDEPTLVGMAEKMEADLAKACSRIDGLEGRLSGGLAGCEKADGRPDLSGVGPSLSRCVGLLNRLHVGLNALEQRVG